MEEELAAYDSKLHDILKEDAVGDVILARPLDGDRHVLRRMEENACHILCAYRGKRACLFPPAVVENVVVASPAGWDPRLLPKQDAFARVRGFLDCILQKLGGGWELLKALGDEGGVGLATPGPSLEEVAMWGDEEGFPKYVSDAQALLVHRVALLAEDLRATIVSEMPEECRPSPGEFPLSGAERRLLKVGGVRDATSWCNAMEDIAVILEAAGEAWVMLAHPGATEEEKRAMQDHMKTLRIHHASGGIEAPHLWWIHGPVLERALEQAGEPCDGLEMRALWAGAVPASKVLEVTGVHFAVFFNNRNHGERDFVALSNEEAGQALSVSVECIRCMLSKRRAMWRPASELTDPKDVARWVNQAHQWLKLAENREVKSTSLCEPFRPLRFLGTVPEATPYTWYWAAILFLVFNEVVPEMLPGVPTTPDADQLFRGMPTSKDTRDLTAHWSRALPAVEVSEEMRWLGTDPGTRLENLLDGRLASDSRQVCLDGLRFLLGRAGQRVDGVAASDVTMAGAETEALERLSTVLEQWLIAPHPSVDPGGIAPHPPADSGGVAPHPPADAGGIAPHPPADAGGIAPPEEAGTVVLGQPSAALTEVETSELQAEPAEGGRVSLAPVAEQAGSLGVEEGRPVPAGTGGLLAAEPERPLDHAFGGPSDEITLGLPRALANRVERDGRSLWVGGAVPDVVARSVPQRLCRALLLARLVANRFGANEDFLSRFLPWILRGEADRGDLDELWIELLLKHGEENPAKYVLGDLKLFEGWILEKNLRWVWNLPAVGAVIRRCGQAGREEDVVAVYNGLVAWRGMLGAEALTLEGLQWLATAWGVPDVRGDWERVAAQPVWPDGEVALWGTHIDEMGRGAAEVRGQLTDGPGSAAASDFEHLGRAFWMGRLRYKAVRGHCERLAKESLCQPLLEVVERMPPWRSWLDPEARPQLEANWRTTGETGALPEGVPAAVAKAVAGKVHESHVEVRKRTREFRRGALVAEPERQSDHLVLVPREVSDNKAATQRD
jgi:hypothetical protein